MTTLKEQREDILNGINENIEELKKELDTVISDHARNVILRDEAKEDGDLIENAAYSTACAEVERLEYRRVNLTNQISLMEEANIPHEHSGFVSIGSMVRVKSADGTIEKTFLLVSHALGNATRNRVSVLSPVGAAVLNKCAGESFLVNTSAQSIQYRIEEVL